MLESYVTQAIPFHVAPVGRAAGITTRTKANLTREGATIS